MTNQNASEQELAALERPKEAGDSALLDVEAKQLANSGELSLGDLLRPRLPSGRQDLSDGQLIGNDRRLERAPEPQPGATVGRQPGDVLTVEVDPSAIGGRVSGDDVEQRGFTRSVGPGNANDL